MDIDNDRHNKILIYFALMQFFRADKNLAPFSSSSGPSDTIHKCAQWHWQMIYKALWINKIDERIEWKNHFNFSFNTALWSSFGPKWSSLRPWFQGEF